MRTTKRRYMWGIGTVCSLLFLAITCSWTIEGRIGYRLRSFGGASAGEIRKENAPSLFWIIAGSPITAGVFSTIVTSVGLSKAQRDECKTA